MKLHRTFLKIVAVLFLAIIVGVGNVRISSIALAQDSGIVSNNDVMRGATSTATVTSTSTATSTNTATSTITIEVMKHLCNSNIKTIDDFKALETNRDPVSALANTVLNCPTTGLPSNSAATGTVASPRMTFDFRLDSDATSTADQNSTSTMINSATSTTATNSTTATSSMSQVLSDSFFHQMKLCESDINKDVNGNGSIESDVCLDISHYKFELNSPNSKVNVTEVMPPQGYHFGTLKFTPRELAENNDQESLVQTVTDPNTNQSQIRLDLKNDTDKTVMLHIYNFVNAEATSTASSTASSTTSNSNSASSTSTSTATTTNSALSAANSAEILSIMNDLHSLENRLNALLQGNQ